MGLLQQSKLRYPASVLTQRLLSDGVLPSMISDSSRFGGEIEGPALFACPIWFPINATEKLSEREGFLVFIYAFL